VPAPHGPAGRADVSTLVPAEAMQQPLDIEVASGPLRGGGRLVADYLAGHPALGPFYAGHPGDADAFTQKAAEVEARLNAAARSRVASAIEPLGDAAERLHRILAGDGFFVTTGQQPALFGGPLYTLYKALAAVRLAATLERQLQRPVLALFWIGADDHDWEEANRAAALDRDGYVRQVSVRSATAKVPVPLSERVWGPGIEQATAEFCSLLPGTAYAETITAHLQEAYTADARVADSFCATCRFLLAGHRIALVSSAHPAVRAAAVPVLRFEAEHMREHALVLARQTERLVEAGYTGQVTLAADASNLMLSDDLGRDRLMRGDDGWFTRRGGRLISEDALLQLIEAEPARVSPNVLLRPVVESAVFPTVAYVAGPAELRYFAQIGCLFRAHGITAPVVVPRQSGTLIEAKVRTALLRAGLEADAFERPFSEIVVGMVREQLPPAVTAALERIRSDLRAGYAELVSAATDADPTLRGPLGSARNASLRQVAAAERKIVRQVRSRNAVMVDRLRRIAASLQPHGAPQERVLSPLPFVARHGPALTLLIEQKLGMEPPPAARWDGPLCEDA
jgi:bacillithiol synthase